MKKKTKIKKPTNLVKYLVSQDTKTNTFTLQAKTKDTTSTIAQSQSLNEVLGTLFNIYSNYEFKVTPEVTVH